MLSLRQFIRAWDVASARRASGLPFPWVDDPVLQRYRFGHFRRELDRFNRHLLTKFAGRALDPPIIRNLVANRMTSQYKFVSEYGPFNIFADFHNAYLNAKAKGVDVRPASFMSCRSDDQFLGAIKTCFDNAWSSVTVLKEEPTLRVVYNEFRGTLGKFTAWQLALDFLMLGYVTNPDGFAYLGPGSAVALQNLGFPGHISQLPALLDLVNESPGQYPLQVDELEGALCEYSRYVRLQDWRFPGKYRLYRPSAEPLPPVDLEGKLREFYAY